MAISRDSMVLPDALFDDRNQTSAACHGAGGEENGHWLIALRLRLFAHDLRTDHQITEAERSIFKPFHARERKHVGFSSDAPIRLV